MVLTSQQSMASNLTDWEQLIDMEEISGFAEFLSALNFTFKPTNNVTHESLLTRPDTIIAIFLISIASILNILAICGTYNIPNGLTTHSKLIISLAFSDILIAISVFAHLLSKIMNEDVNPFIYNAEERIGIACSIAFINSLNVMAHLISLLNLLMMAVDHFVAIINPYQYKFLLNKRKGIMIIVIMWFAAFVGGFINFLTEVGSSQNGKNKKLNYCEKIMYNEFHGEYLVIGCTFLSLIAIIFIYLRLYYEVWKMNKRLAQLTFNKEHNSKTLKTTLLIIGTFAVCWIPLFTFNTILLIQVQIDPDSLMDKFKSLVTANKYLYLLLLVNSICDPIIYAARLKEVQLGYKKFFKLICVKISDLGIGNWRQSPLLFKNKRKMTMTSDQEGVERTMTIYMSENVCEKDTNQINNETETNTLLNI